jgi:hypothetical protein
MASPATQQVVPTMRMEALVMIGAKLREAMDLLRSLNQQYPADPKSCCNNDSEKC